MNASSKAASLKLALPTSISNLAMYSSAIIPIVIFRVCSWAYTVLYQSGSPKDLLMPASSSVRVENMEVWDKTTLVWFLAQNCTIPPCMKERAYRIFILSSMNMSSCMVMVIQTDWMNCSALSLLLSKVSSSVGFTPLGEWLPIGMFVRIACATADAALAAASDTLVQVSMVRSLSALLADWSWLGKLLRLGVENFT